MDRKTALKILDLDPNATFDEAKTAYRHLAKQYHPDVTGADRGDEKMKAINSAFVYLSPILKSHQKQFHHTEPPGPKQSNRRRTGPEKKKESQKNENGSWYTGFIRSAKRFLRTKKSHTNRNSKTFQAKRPNFKRENIGRVHFSSVFENVHDSGRIPRKKRSGRPINHHGQRRSDFCRSNAYKRYQAYVSYKKKMRALQQKRQNRDGVTRVERIQPIRPVNGVSQDDF